MEEPDNAEIACNLQCDWVNVLLASNVADNAARRRLTGRALDGSGGTGDEGNVCASGDKQSDKR